MYRRHENVMWVWVLNLLNFIGAIQQNSITNANTIVVVRNTKCHSRGTGNTHVPFKCHRPQITYHHVPSSTVKYHRVPPDTYQVPFDDHSSAAVHLLFEAAPRNLCGTSSVPTAVIWLVPLSSTLLLFCTNAVQQLATRHATAANGWLRRRASSVEACLVLSSTFP